jgi:hypothetical protein
VWGRDAARWIFYDYVEIFSIKKNYNMLQELTEKFQPVTVPVLDKTLAGGKFMNQTIRTSLLAAAALAVFVVPALADTACTVTASEIRLRKSPSKKAHVVAVLKKDARVTAVGKCSGGWVKVASEDGRLSGYVGGWAISEAAPTVVASIDPAVPAPSRTDAAEQARREIPTNEQLAVQITQLRLNVLGLDRNMEKMNKEIQKIKVSIARKGGHKGHRHSKKI